MLPVSVCALALASAAPPACPAVRNGTAFHSAESFITIPVDEPLACCTACVANASCASWTAQGKRCHLKHGLPPDGGEPSPGSVSGAIPGRGGRPMPPPPAPWPAPPASHKLKNVVLVISDDMRPSLGAYGQPAISPHLDAFAKQGTVFQSAYVQVAWCSPCRNSFLSGRRPDRTHIWTTPGTEPGLGFRAHGADWVTLPGYFKAAGYITTAGGKIFHPDEPSDNDPTSWTDSASCPDNNTGDRGDDGPCTYWRYSFGGYASCDNVNASCEHCTTGAWCSVVDSEPTADETTAAIMTQRMRDIQASNTTRPFFMACGFLKPHLPCALLTALDPLPNPTHTTFYTDLETPGLRYCHQTAKSLTNQMKLEQVRSASPLLCCS